MKKNKGRKVGKALEIRGGQLGEVGELLKMMGEYEKSGKTSEGLRNPFFAVFLNLKPY